MEVKRCKLACFVEISFVLAPICITMMMEAQVLILFQRVRSGEREFRLRNKLRTNMNVTNMYAISEIPRAPTYGCETSTK